ncbi:MAG TPA: Rid family detoxifying hydrolase [Candidatus Limnocylindria bacterium]|jgi:2-iminobutanoate/2-iminopropanoate deaminase|nr:Rid family detoxifying hydrolase [Candidatus Limnocylindria bacterium]
MRSAIRTDQAPRPAAAYEQAIVSGDLIFVSGQVATDPATGTIHAATIEEQVTQVLQNVEAIVEAGGGDRRSIVRCGVFLADLKDFAAMNRAYQEFFGETLPARTTVQAGLGELRVEIDAIAVRRRVAARGARASKRRHRAVTRSPKRR